MPTLRVIGSGRAGGSLARALSSVGWDVVEVLGRGDDPTAAARDVEVLAIATPDAMVEQVAARVTPVAETLVMHLSGSLTLGVLGAHPRRASLHPLASLPDPDTGAAVLLDGCPMAIAGDPGVAEVAAALGGHVFEVPDDNRSLYHATASVAANHVVALCAQVERLAAECRVPAAAFLSMTGQVVRNAGERGAVASLTGPAARGDSATIERHLAALPAAETGLYGVLAREAARLAGATLEVGWR